MPQYRISEAAELLGVSDDTVRRWVDDGQLEAVPDAAGRKVVDGAALARHAQDVAARTATHGRDDGVGRSARNRFTGLVTRVVADGVMAQVELQCGPYRVVSLMSSEAATELGLEPGSLATAVVKATNVIVETPAAPARSRGGKA
jgi:molybdopterin-binding protein